MLLALSVISANSGLLGASSYKVFDARGGSIGRKEGNDWVLPDPPVSGRHANISFRQGVFCIEDVSTNGTGFNDPHTVIARGTLQPLRDGDRLYLGDCEVLVQVLADAQPQAVTQVTQPALPAISATQQLKALRLPEAGGRSVLDDLLTPRAEPPPAAYEEPPPRPAPVHMPSPAMPAPMMAPAPAPPPSPPRPPPPPPPQSVPPVVPVPAGFIPDDYAPTGFNLPRSIAPPTPAPMPTPALMPTPAFVQVPPAPVAAAPLSPPMPLPPPVAPAAPPSGDMSALLANLGLRPQDVPPDTMAQLGQIMRVVVQGLMEVLLARKQVKDNFRMAMTIIRPRENNPLKFSASPEDAMYTLFVKRNPGFLEPVAAFREAFDDLSFHQLATLAGMRAAFFATLSRFDPAALEAQWEKAAGKKSRGLFSGGKSSWEQFCEHYARMTHDSEANFQQVFGEAFVRAYDDQIRKLQEARARHP